MMFKYLMIAVLVAGISGLSLLETSTEKDVAAEATSQTATNEDKSDEDSKEHVSEEHDKCIHPEEEHDQNLVFFRKLGEYVWEDDHCHENHTNSYYVSQNLKLTWTDAFLFCKAFNMELATFETKEEETFVLDLIAAKWLNIMESQNFIGGTKIGSDTWYWIPTGDLVDYKIRWRNGEPNNLEGNEKCLSVGHYHSSFAVNDVDCYKSQRSFICEKYEGKGKAHNDYGHGHYHGYPHAHPHGRK